MVAKSPPKERQKRLAAAVNPNIIRETVKKVDKCVARLQELQYTVSGGRKVVGDSSLSPRSTRSYLRASLRCKQETLRLKNISAQKSPPGKFPANTTGEWRRMSLPAMLLGETLAEIQQATQFAKQAAIGAKPNNNISGDPKTPLTHRTRGATTSSNKNINQLQEITTPLLRSRRMREKQTLRRTMRTEFGTPTHPNPRARARITFKPTSPSSTRRDASYRHVAAAHRESPKSKPWTKKKTPVLFPNPTFNPSSSSSTPHLRMMPSKPKSPMMIPGIKRSPPHRFIVKSPTANSKVQIRIKTPPPTVSPTRRSSSRMSPANLLRRSFSPSRLANRLVSPLKSKISAYRRSCGSGAALLAGTSQTPEFSTPMRIPPGRRK